MVGGSTSPSQLQYALVDECRVPVHGLGLANEDYRRPRPGLRHCVRRNRSCFDRADPGIA